MPPRRTSVTTRPASWLPIIAPRPTTSPSSSGGGGGGSFDNSVNIAASSGVYAVPFSVVDLGASLTASRLYRAVAGAASVVGRQIPHQALFRGYIAGLALSADAAKSGGTATFETFIDGAGVGVNGQLVWTTGRQTQVQPFEQNLHTFSADQQLDVRVTTDGGFTPTTVDLILDLLLVATNEVATT